MPTRPVGTAFKKMLNGILSQLYRTTMILHLRVLGILGNRIDYNDNARGNYLLYSILLIDILIY